MSTMSTIINATAARGGRSAHRGRGSVARLWSSLERQTADFLASVMRAAFHRPAFGEEQTPDFLVSGGRSVAAGRGSFAFAGRKFAFALLFAALASTLALAAMALAAASFVSPALAQEKTVLKLGHLANEENSWHLASVKFGEELAALTGGRITVEVYPNESLGKEIDLINGMQLGTVDMTITGESLQNWAPKAALLAIPYGFQTIEDMDAFASGSVGDEIKEQIVEKVQIRPIAYFARGARNLTSNRPIRHPDDLDGLKMRVPNVPLFVDVWNALGANPGPMAFSEVFTSLQNGNIESQENPLALIRSASFYEVQSHVNLTSHVRSWIYLTIAESTWQGFSAAEQAAVMEAAARAQAYERGLFEESLAEDRAFLESKGMTFVDVDAAAFQAAAKDAVLANVSDEIKATVEGLFAN